MITPYTLLQRIAGMAATVTAASRAWQFLLLMLIVAVSYLALTPAPPEHLTTGWDKANHMLGFTALAFSARLGYPAARRTWLLWLFALVAYGGLIEILQMFVPGRSSEWGDLFADSIGIACGALVAAYLLKSVSTRSSNRS
jgi:VanZ family protein